MHVTGWFLLTPKIAMAAASTAALLAGPAGVSARLIQGGREAAPSIVSPAAAYHYSPLLSVAAAPGSQAWAVGLSTDGSTQNPLIERWNGSLWKIVPSPNPGARLRPEQARRRGRHLGVQRLGGGLVHQRQHRLHPDRALERGRLVAGAQPEPGRRDQPDESVWRGGHLGLERLGRWLLLRTARYLTLTEHWNGKTWAQVPSPSPAGADGSFLTGVAATSPINAWAVGYCGTGGAKIKP